MVSQPEASVLFCTTVLELLVLPDVGQVQRRRWREDVLEVFGSRLLKAM